jgi:crotonobetainyl-CoA:carnitine CoA-transferase CaiB-like acyl-CoA transferase
MDKPLTGFKVLDISHRLPGPMAGKILSDLGAEVIKVEDHKFKDPFAAGLFADFDESFKDWYEALNKGKKIIRFDFNKEEDKLKIHELLKNADAVIMGLPPSTRNKLSLNDSDLDLNRPFVVIELLASRKHNRSLHDLNALADEGLLSLHVQGRKEKIIDPPFLPISGICFGLMGATNLVASFLTAVKQNKTVFAKTYLDESTEEIFGIFWPKKDRHNQRKKYLHNGKYPCYSIYQTKDGHYLALAAVEEKFWNRVCEVFNIDKSIDRFYDKDDSVFELISKSFSSLTVDEINSKVGEEDLCLSIIS